MTQKEHDELYRAVERGELAWGRGEKPHPATRIFEQPYEEARCTRCGGSVGFHHECREDSDNG